MSRFTVTAWSKCQECRGTGRIRLSPGYELWTEFYKTSLPISKASAWFADQGYDEPPPADKECEVCHGSGMLSSEVDLVDALKELIEWA